MDNFINVVTEDGQRFKAEVIDIFNVDAYPDKDYIIYSFGEEVSNDEEKVYVSIIENKNDEYNLVGISDPAEWAIVQEAINNTAEDRDDIDE